jgi:hypothetical protein
VIDGGYGKLKGKTFRISNMGDETDETIAADAQGARRALAETPLGARGLKPSAKSPTATRAFHPPFRGSRDLNTYFPTAAMTALQKTKP